MDSNNNNHEARTFCGSKSSGLTASKSDYGVIEYLRADSNEPLLEASRALSEGSLTFDNPAYLNSNGELSTQVPLGGNSISIPHSCRRSTATSYGKLSRSLNSMQDVVHDSYAAGMGSTATLPGTILSRSEETVNGTTCTVRNITLDECSQAWTETWEDDTATDIPELECTATPSTTKATDVSNT